MSEIVLLKRVGSLEELSKTPLAWLPSEHSKALVSCVHGHIAGIPDHSVSNDGTVSPSLLLDWPVGGVNQCGWHVFARLEGWEAV